MLQACGWLPHHGLDLSWIAWGPGCRGMSKSYSVPTPYMLLLSARALLMTADQQPGCAVSLAKFDMKDTEIRNCSTIFSGGAIHTESAANIAPLVNITIQVSFLKMSSGLGLSRMMQCP